MSTKENADEEPLASLDLLPLERAIMRLRRSVGFVDSELARDAALREEFQQSAIKAFEYTFGLSVRLLEVFLRFAATDEFEKHPTYRTLLRAAIDEEILGGDFAAWLNFRECRNVASHAYDAAKAGEVYAVIPAFLLEVETLYAAMSARVAAARA